MAIGPGITYGIRVGFTPDAGTWTIELQRSSGTITNTDWVRVAKVSSDEPYYDDVLPNNNGIYNYRARLQKTGYTAGAWSTRVSARPTELGEPT